MKLQDFSLLCALTTDGHPFCPSFVPLQGTGGFILVSAPHPSFRLSCISSLNCLDPPRSCRISSQNLLSCPNAVAFPQGGVQEIRLAWPWLSASGRWGKAENCWLYLVSGDLGEELGAWQDFLTAWRLPESRGAACPIPRAQTQMVPVSP